MPRAAAVSTNEIINALAQVEIFQDTKGTLKPRSNKVWNDVCALLENKIKRDTLFLHVQKDRNNVLTKIKQQMNIDINEVSVNTSKDNSIDQSTESIVSSDVSGICKNNYNCPDLLFDLDIDDVSWNSIAPFSVIYKEKSRYSNKRRYTVLKQGWTDVIQKACWEKSKLPCAYSFKRAKIFDHEKSVYLKIVGKCNECSAIFEGHCLKKPIPGHGIKISVKTKDTRGVPHVSKRMLKGKERQEVQQELLSTKAANWRCKVTKIMAYGDPEPSHLYSNSVLRKARQEAKDKDLGLYKIPDPLISLQKIKYNVEFANIIREIALDKFYCMYWSPMQLDLYKDIIKTKVPLSIDATGSIVHKLRRLNNQSNAIFLYQAVVPTEKGIFPVFQILSEKHDANTISYFIKEWLRSGVSAPYETVTDFSFALLNGISLAFNEYNLKTYVDNCLRHLSGKNVQIPIRCYIRVDIAHLIKMITKWKCFNNKLPRIKDFYVRCIGLITTCKNNSDFEKIISAVFIVCFSECDDNGTDCNKQETFLLNAIQTFSIELNKESDDDINTSIEYSEDLDEEFDYDCPQLIKIYDNAKLIAEKTRSLMRPNPYYAPEFAKSLMRLCHYYVLWTNVMSECSKTNYTVASSARSESYFNEIKNIILCDDNKPLRLDKFIIKHVRSITATCKIQRAAYNATLNTHEISSEISKAAESSDCSTSVTKAVELSENINYTTEFLEQHLQEEENWRGQNKRSMRTNEHNKSIPSKRGKYLQACPNVTLMHNRPLRKRKDIIIQNGNLLASVKIEKIKVQVMNTCSFDSIIELITNGYSDYIEYQRQVRIEFSDFEFFDLVIDYATNNITSKWYIKRALCLFKTLDKPLASILDCSYNISSLISKLLHDIPSTTNKFTCKKCKTNSTIIKSVLQIDSKPILTEGLKTGLEKSLNKYFSTKKKVYCNSCKSYGYEFSEPGPHLLIDTEHPFISMLQIDSVIISEIPLSEIPHFIMIKNIKYVLIGVIHFIPPEIRNGVGHYVAFCKTVTGSWKQCDDAKYKADLIPNGSLSSTLVRPAIIGYVKI